MRRRQRSSGSLELVRVIGQSQVVATGSSDTIFVALDVAQGLDLASDFGVLLLDLRKM